MKALHVVHRVCHYIALWLFVAVGAYLLFVALPAAIVAPSVVGYNAYIGAEVSEAVTAQEVYDVLGDSLYESAAGGVFASAELFIPVIIFIIAVVHLVASILFRQLRDLVKHNKEKKCHCGCECGEVKSDLDAQVAEVLKWKNLYVEGVITEREFIDKRNEILRISK